MNTVPDGAVTVTLSLAARGRDSLLVEIDIPDGEFENMVERLFNEAKKNLL